MYFHCTECGKCCKVEGEVWLSPNEVSDIAIFKGMSKDKFFQKFGMERKDGWVKLKNKEIDSKNVTYWVVFPINNFLLTIVNDCQHISNF